MVYGFQLRYDEIVDILDLKEIPTKRIGCSLASGIYEVFDLSDTLNYIPPNNLKVTVANDKIRLKSNIKFNQTLVFTMRSFFLYKFKFSLITFLSSRGYRRILTIDCAIIKE